MPKALSMDLRQRIVHAFLNKEGTTKEVAERFQVGSATVTRMVAKYRSGEGLQRKRPTGRRRKAIIGEELELLKSLVDKHPDYSGQELAWELNELTGKNYHRATINRRLVELNYTVKKNGFCRRTIDRTSPSVAPRAYDMAVDDRS